MYCVFRQTLIINSAVEIQKTKCLMNQTDQHKIASDIFHNDNKNLNVRCSTECCIVTKTWRCFPWRDSTVYFFYIWYNRDTLLDSLVLDITIIERQTTSAYLGRATSYLQTDENCLLIPYKFTSLGLYGNNSNIVSYIFYAIAIKVTYDVLYNFAVTIAIMTAPRVQIMCSDPDTQSSIRGQWTKYVKYNTLTRGKRNTKI